MDAASVPAPQHLASIDIARPRGPISERLLASLRAQPHDLAWSVVPDADADDLHLSLYCCYELHYQGLVGVDAKWEWEPSLLAVRRQLERQFAADLRAAVGTIECPSRDVVRRLREIAGAEGGPSLSQWMVEHGSLHHMRELAVHRSAYQLKEGDPHTWAIPRLTGAAKAVMTAIQADEYGNGNAARMHSSLFAVTMAALNLDPTPNRYLHEIPGVTLATSNLISMLGLHRAWRGALVGHLALFEMTSVGPMTRYGQAMRRLGLPEAACRFYDAHIEADRVHARLATEGMVAGLLKDHPDLAVDVVFGANALATLERRFATHVLGRWEHGLTSLRSSATGVHVHLSRVAVDGAAAPVLSLRHA